MNGTDPKGILRRTLIAVALALALPGFAWAQASCNGLITVSYTSAINFALPGDVVRVRLQIGTGPIMPTGNLVINRLRFNLDCTNTTLAAGLGCTDEGLFVEYQGDATITDTCPGVSFTTGHAVSGAPNQVVFTPTMPLVIPQNQAVPPGFCQLEFDVKVLAAPSIDGTPNAIEEVGGYDPGLVDAFCTNAVPVTGGVQSAAIPLCPACTDTECTTSACNQDTGQCVPTNKPDSTPCGDTDQNLCTTAGCEAGQCVQTHLNTPCPPDSNDCTNDPPCNPQTGQCTHPPVPDSTPCGDTDSNLCTTAGCEAGNCVQTHNQTVCQPDTNQCTSDPPCNPATGLCEHPNVPDSTPCADTDANVCTVAGCEAGQCVQSHIPDVCETPNHFTCYEIKPFAFTAIPNVSLVDQFGSSVVSAERPHKFCAPADKNGEDPTAPTDPDHLTAYKIRNRFTKVLNQTVQNQFGTIKVDVVKPDLLFVPTLKSLAAPAPGAPIDPAVDHFQCYKAKRSKGSPKFQKILNVNVEDQFGTGLIDLLKPSHLCAPANKRNEEPGAELHPFHLLCYKVKARAPFNQKHVWLGNQLGSLNDLLLVRRQEFCVPSLKNPGTTTTTVATTTTTTTAPTTTTTTTTSTTTTTLASPSGAFLDGELVD
jgi:hypothetical protein